VFWLAISLTTRHVIGKIRGIHGRNSTGLYHCEKVNHFQMLILFVLFCWEIPLFMLLMSPGVREILFFFWYPQVEKVGSNQFWKIAQSATQLAFFCSRIHHEMLENFSIFCTLSEDLKKKSHSVANWNAQVIVSLTQHLSFYFLWNKEKDFVCIQI